MRLILVFIHFIKFILSLTVTVLLLYPRTMIYKHPCTKMEYRNDTFDVRTEAGCRMPPVNFNVDKKEITRALNLPDGTLLSEQLHNIGKCKAAIMKLGGNEAVCFCLGYWPMFMCATAVVSWCLMSLIDVVLNLVKSKAFQTYTEWWIEKRCSQLAMGLFFAVWIVVGFHIDSLRNNLRFTLPNTVGDREYYETPLAWYLIILFCVLYVGMCVAEILVLRSNANSGYVPPTVRPGSPKLDKSPSAEPIFVVLFDFDAKPPLTEEKLSLNKKPEDSPSSKDKESAPSSSSSKLESAFEFSSLRVPEVSSQSRPAEVVQHDTPKYQNGPKAKSAELKFISDETEKIFLDQSISV